ncbi:hypothetical protein CYMTET_5955 [Cymbomonas tetramitiformis]|uniref:PspA/IM30 family protein n=1 Tax=Cymbomonas tetramitiformis TaxID=36881 RepID=A0AAE0GY42_9CHLO|nr:hypothetical protein CYMTET_5955 [Cymbomonas tetramitiformis]
MSRIWKSFRDLYRNINKLNAQTKEIEALKAKRTRLQEDMNAFEGHKAASRAIDDARNLAIVRAAVTGAEQFDSKLKEQGEIFIAAQKELHAQSQKEMERHVKDQEEQMGKIATRFAQSSAIDFAANVNKLKEDVDKTSTEVSSQVPTSGEYGTAK